MSPADVWDWYVGTQQTAVGRAVLWTLIVVLVVEAIGAFVQASVRWYRARHLPRHRVRQFWEMAVTDRLAIALGVETSGERRARLRVGHRNTLLRRQEHALARFDASYPAPVHPEAVGPAEAVSEPVLPVPHFGAPERMSYRPEEYEEPLRCSIDDWLLLTGEEFWAVPVTTNPNGFFLVICSRCQVGPGVKS